MAPLQVAGVSAERSRPAPAGRAPRLPARPQPCCWWSRLRRATQGGAAAPPPRLSTSPPASSRAHGTAKRASATTMAEALATKKRHFYRALDNLTTDSATSLHSAASAHQTGVAASTNAKRPATAAAAFDEARERAAKRLRHSTSSSSLPPTALVTPVQSRTKQASPHQTHPNYAPWSHDAFLARLKTFRSVSLWHPKPETIGEVEWAKRGWVCVDVNTVGCRGGCERRVVVSLDRPSDVPARQEHD